MIYEYMLAERSCSGMIYVIIYAYDECSYR